LLSDRHIIANPTARSIEETICEHAARAAEITDVSADVIVKATSARERIMHTGLPHGLAVPHARLDNLAKPCMIISLHRHGIDFDAPDGQLARIVCLLLTPADQPDSQIELLSLFATTFDHAPTRQAALGAQSATEFLAVLNLAEADRTNPVPA